MKLVSRANAQHENVDCATTCAHQTHERAVKEDRLIFPHAGRSDVRGSAVYSSLQSRQLGARLPCASRLQCTLPSRATCLCFCERISVNPLRVLHFGLHSRACPRAGVTACHCLLCMVSMWESWCTVGSGLSAVGAASNQCAPTDNAHNILLHPRHFANARTRGDAIVQKATSHPPCLHLYLHDALQP